MDLMEAPSSWKIVKLVFLRKPDAEPKKGTRSYRATALTSVMSKWYASCIILRLEKGKEKELESCKKSHVGGIESISCQHSQVMMTNLLQKYLGMAGGQKTNDYARQRDTTHNVVGEHGHQVGLRRGETEAHCTNYGGAQCPWLNYCSPLTRDGRIRRTGHVESKFRFARCIRQGSVEAPRLRQKMAMQILSKVEQGWTKKIMGVGRAKNSDLQFYIGRQLLGHVPFEGPLGTDDEGSNSGSRKMGLRTEARKLVVHEYL